MNHLPRVDLHTLHDHPSQNGSSIQPSGEEGMGMGDVIALLWSGRFIIPLSLLVGLLLGMAYVFMATPIYQVNAMLQVEGKKSGRANPNLTLLTEGLFEGASTAQAEVEILKSDMVIGRTVEALHLDILAKPKQLPFIGALLARKGPFVRSIEVEQLECQPQERPFLLETIDAESFTLKSPEGEPISKGRIGERLQTQWQGSPIALKVRSIKAPVGQGFFLQRAYLSDAIEKVRGALNVAEKGKQTNIIALSYQHTSGLQGAEILNTLLEHYIRQNIERKAEEASKSLHFLQEQLPIMKGKVEIAEEKLNHYRTSKNATDLTEETKVALKQSADQEAQLTLLNLKREETLRTYQSHSDVVKNLDQQIGRLKQACQRVEGSLRGLPSKQQEMVRLLREVEVNQSLLTSMMNSIQQLQVTKAGEIGNVRIIDHALLKRQPIKPQIPTVIGLGGALGLFMGIGWIMMRRALNQGVEDPQLLEPLGLPVLATIPHSVEQEQLHKNTHKGDTQIRLLAEHAPGSTAIESLRSLRTSLQFLLLDTPSKVVMIAGPAPGIGKSFVCANLACMLSQANAKVLLVDADLRKGKLHQHFSKAHRQKGLSDILAGKMGWQDAIQYVHGIDFISTGALPPNPAEILSRPQLKDFIKAISPAYDFVIVDVPPILAVTDALLLAPHADAVLLTLKAGQHPLAEIRTMLHRMETTGCKAKGFIFNDMLLMGKKYGYQPYGYVYEYTTGKA